MQFSLSEIRVVRVVDWGKETTSHRGLFRSFHS